MEPTSVKLEPDATVSVAEPPIEPNRAEIEVEPAATPVARPVLVMVATLGTTELHVTRLVMFCVLLSLQVPEAVNCCVLPTTTKALAGETAIDTSTGGATVRV